MKEFTEKEIEMALDWWENLNDEERIEIITDLWEENMKETEELINKCEHSWIDSDNEGCYGIEICRFCGKERKKGE